MLLAVCLLNGCGVPAPEHQSKVRHAARAVWGSDRREESGAAPLAMHPDYYKTDLSAFQDQPLNPTACDPSDADGNPDDDDCSSKQQAP